MSKNRPGSRLAVALPSSFPRWLDSLLWAAFITGLLVPLGYFVVALRSNTVGRNNGLLEILSGLLGIALLVRLVRVTVLRMFAAPLVVEVSRNPAIVGKPWDYLLKSRGSMEACLVCLQPKGRSAVLTLLKVPLLCGEVGTLTFPDLPEGAAPTALRPASWEIRIRVHFGRGFVLEEDYRLRVETESTYLSP